ncbi:MAG: hypothetical protein JWR83_1614 [Aeromicrobium sp.]|nr:hypothetical protein [Aeromicrobium sp.]
MAKVLSYVVKRDYGFAPNPFQGRCTLATCISPVRRAANVGDLVIGTGTATEGLAGKIVYAMEVSEALTFNEYWDDLRYASKRPITNGSRKQQYGDNIYHRVDDEWLQADSHHSLPDGSLNPKNVRSDTAVDRVLVADRFTYWGGDGPAIPPVFRNWNGVDIVRHGIGHRHNYPDDLVAAFRGWLEPQLGQGRVGRPFSW